MPPLGEIEFVGHEELESFRGPEGETIHFPIEQFGEEQEVVIDFEGPILKIEGSEVDKEKIKALAEELDRYDIDFWMGKTGKEVLSLEADCRLTLDSPLPELPFVVEAEREKLEEVT